MYNTCTYYVYISTHCFTINTSDLSELTVFKHKNLWIFFFANSGGVSLTCQVEEGPVEPKNTPSLVVFGLRAVHFRRIKMPRKNRQIFHHEIYKKSSSINILPRKKWVKHGETHIKIWLLKPDFGFGFQLFILRVQVEKSWICSFSGNWREDVCRLDVCNQMILKLLRKEYSL